MGLGIALAGVACILYGAATLLQAAGSKQSDGLKAFLQPLVIIGLVVDGAAFLVSLEAYVRAPLFVVQTVIAAAVVVAVLGAPLVLPVTLRPLDVWGAIIVVVGLVFVAAAAGAERPVYPSAHVVWLTVALSVVLAVVTVLAYPKGPPWLVALCAGIGFGLVGIGTRLVDISGGGGWWQTLAQPGVLVIAIGGLVGVVGNIRALQRGSVAIAASIVSVVEVILPSAVGVWLLGDTVRAGWSGGLILAIGVALTGCVILAASPAGRATATA